ncbi:MAG TPA: hypothetical protein VLN49_07845 [Gemmatimonadaceae bacterium]|nr:hypothetical protein [Gemmatimonadaceae bacterium]
MLMTMAVAGALCGIACAHSESSPGGDSDDRADAKIASIGPSSNSEALVGDVAVGLESLEGKPSLDLLRAAVARVH